MDEFICTCGQTLVKGDKYYKIEGDIWCENCIDPVSYTHLTLPTKA